MSKQLILLILLAVLARGTVKSQKDTIWQVTSNGTIMPIGFDHTITYDTIPVLRMVSDTSFHHATYSVWVMRMYEVREVCCSMNGSPGITRHVRYLDLHYSRLNEHLKVWETIQ